jgi:hypothetical protein
MGFGNVKKALLFVCHSFHLKTADNQITFRLYIIHVPYTKAVYSVYSSKGKAIPLKAWTGHEVSRRLRLIDFKTIGTLRW